LLSSFFDRSVFFQGIGVKGLGLRQLQALPSRLAKANLPDGSSTVNSGILPVLPIRRGPAAKLSAWMIKRRLTALTRGRFDEWVIWMRFPSPELVSAIRDCPFARVVYEPVDRYAAEPVFSANDRQRLGSAEEELARRAMVVTTSAGLAKQFDSAGGGSHWLPTGMDTSLKATRVSRMDAIPRPRLGVVGSLDWLADEALLLDLAMKRPDWHLVLAGPREGNWGRQLERLPNVYWFGPVKPDEARGLIAACDVALNPCVLNEWTEEAFPVKVFDYLAEGRPVVSTQMSELDIFRDLIELVPSGQFVAAIEQAMATDGPEAVSRRKQASQRFTAQDRARHAFELLIDTPTSVKAMHN